jgi:hypothetical protein
MLGDEMGLGKTVQSLAVAEKIKKKHGRVGIVAPAGLVSKWRDEIKKHLGESRKYSFSIASYNELTKPENLYFFTREPFDLCIFDEAHYVKDFEAQRTRATLGAPTDKHRTVTSVWFVEPATYSVVIESAVIDESSGNGSPTPGTLAPTSSTYVSAATCRTGTRKFRSPARLPCKSTE